MFLDNKTKIVKKIFLFIFLLGVFFWDNNVYADWIGDEKLRRLRAALVEVARAYQAKGEYVQYDAYRRSGVYTPEDATSQNTVYMVCSGFTYNIFYNTLGIKIPELTNHNNLGTGNLRDAAYAFRGPNYSDVVIMNLDKDHKGDEKYPTTEEKLPELLKSGNMFSSGKDKQNLLDDESIFTKLKDANSNEYLYAEDFNNYLYNVVEVGDLINFTYYGDNDKKDDNAGHVVLVVNKYKDPTNGKNIIKILESTGETYKLDDSYENYEISGGSIRVMNFDTSFYGANNSFF